MLRQLTAGTVLAGVFWLLSAMPPEGGNAAETSKSDETEDSPERKFDFADALPRIPPTEADDALKTFRLRPGFRIELVAAEPLIRDPVAIDFDENGRMFVVEFPEYNAQHAHEPVEVRGAVKMLEDTNGDGRYDRSTMYVDDLERPTAVACYDGGVFVGVAPDVLYCKDTTGDGRADLREVVFTGFGQEKHRAGQAVLNSFRWGLDNRFHVCTNFAGGDVRAAGEDESRAGPDEARVDEAEPLSVRRRGFLFDPLTREYEVASGGGQHGLALDDWGRKFVCTNSRPIQMLMYDDRYLTRNPHMDAPQPAVRILAEGESQQLYRTSRVEPWRVLRTRLRVEGEFKGPIEGGGTASGYFTAATGITVYRGDAWPKEYRGGIYVGDVASNIIYRAKLESDGLDFVARRAEPEVEFVSSTDTWFRPVQFANGPDGCLYVVDMYRELIEGGRFLPPPVLEHLNVMGGVNRGRIYRIVPEDFDRPELPRLGEASAAELVELLDHPNAWHRETAHRLLHQRQDAGAVEPLRQLVREASLPQGRVHALWTLESLKALREGELLVALADRHPRVREHAVRLSESRLPEAPALREKLARLVDDPDIYVRYQLAFSLGEVAGPLRHRALATLLQKDGACRWMRLAVLSSLQHGCGEIFESLAGSDDFRDRSHGREFLLTLAEQIGKANRRADVAAALKTLEFLSEKDESLAREVVRRLASVRDVGEGERGIAGEGEARRLLDDLLAAARQAAVDGSRKIGERSEAIRTLGLLEFDELLPLARRFLEPRQPPPIQSAAVETLARFRNRRVAELLLEWWPGFSPEVRRQAVEVLLSRPEWVRAFLDRVEKERIRPAEIDPARIRLLQSHPDAKIRKRVETLFAEAQLTGRQDVVDRYQAALELAGDPDRGRTVFRKTCTACHRLEGEGHEVGADLREIRSHGPATVLLHILDPNREVDPRYLSYVVATDAGLTHTGMIVEETANSLTFRRADETTVIVRRAEIEQLRTTGLSFMPEGLEKEIDLQQMADLLSYLEAVE